MDSTEGEHDEIEDWSLPPERIAPVEIPTEESIVTSSREGILTIESEGEEGLMNNHGFFRDMKFEFRVSFCTT